MSFPTLNMCFFLMRKTFLRAENLVRELRRWMLVRLWVLAHCCAGINPRSSRSFRSRRESLRSESASLRWSNNLPFRNTSNIVSEKTLYVFKVAVIKSTQTKLLAQQIHMYMDMLHLRRKQLPFLRGLGQTSHLHFWRWQFSKSSST